MTSESTLLDHPGLTKYVATRDGRLAKARPWSPTPLREALTTLATKGVVTMGGRSTCGTSLDPTWTEFCLWKEVVRKANALGFAITETPLKVANGSPTRSGGWWHESEFRWTGFAAKSAVA